jgi:hypothetical protein
MHQRNHKLHYEHARDAAALRAQLVELHYPWPKILKHKDARWLETELELLASPSTAPRMDARL